MHRITVSVLSLFIVLPSFADARLPVVNIAAGSVSARSAFGAEPLAATKKSEPIVQQQKTNKKIVPRPTIARVASAQGVTNDNIVDASDVLSPRRPSSDLWAKNDTPLRMPRADEFSVLSSDYILPEESLDYNVKPRVVETTTTVAQQDKNTSELDAQIAKLVELQRRVDDDARNVETRPHTITSPVNIATAAVLPPSPGRKIATRDNVTTQKPDTDITVSRMVVPMSAPDVVMRAVEKNTSPRIAATREDMTKMTPNELRKAFRKTFLSENKHLSTYPIDNRFDVASDMNVSTEGFTARRDLSEDASIRPLEIKISFRDSDSALSRDNYDLLSTYASIVVSNPKRAIQVAIPERTTRTNDGRKLAARRLAIVEQVLRDTGVAEQRIMPVLASRSDDSFVLRIISGDQYETMTQQQRDMFGDTVNKKTYKSMSW